MVGLVGYNSSDEEGAPSSPTPSVQRSPNPKPKSSNLPSTEKDRVQAKRRLIPKHKTTPSDSLDRSDHSPSRSLTPSAPKDGPHSRPDSNPEADDSETTSVFPIADLVDDPTDPVLNPAELSPFSFHRSQVRLETVPDSEYADFAIPPSPPGSPQAGLTSRFKMFLDMKRKEKMARGEQGRSRSQTPAAGAPSDGVATGGDPVPGLETAPVWWRTGGWADPTRASADQQNGETSEHGDAEGVGDSDVGGHRPSAGFVSSATAHFNARIADTPALWNPHLQFDPLRAIGVGAHEAYDSALPASPEESQSGLVLAVPSAADWPSWAFATGLRAVHEKMAEVVKEKEKGKDRAKAGDKGKGRAQEADGSGARKIEFVPAGGTIIKRVRS